MGEPEFDTRGYWEERLSADYSLTGVGFRRLGARFNWWAYQVRKDVFQSTLRCIRLDRPGLRVLDVGSGTGFYVERWEEVGACVVGLDLTQTAADALTAAFPDSDFVHGDICDAEIVEALGPRSFDVISAMDVLFHVVDDAALDRALTNMHAVLRPGGHLIFTDMFALRPQQRVRHVAVRTLAKLTTAVEGAGFHIVDRRPSFVLMNEPLDSSSRLYRILWYSMAFLVSRSDRVGGLVGRLMFPLELRLVRNRTESPTTEIMVCRAAGHSQPPRGRAPSTEKL